MIRPQKRDSLAGFALAAAIGIAALIVVSLIGMRQADAGGVRRSVCVQPVVQHQAYAVQQVAAYPVISYGVGEYIQQEAVATQQFRQSQEYIEYQQLIGERRATERVLAALGDRQLPPDQPQYFEESTGRPISPEENERMKANAEAARNGNPIKSEPLAGPTPEEQSAAGHHIPGHPELPFPPPPAPPGSERWDAFKDRYPVTAAMCSSCHGRKNPDKPDGDLFLNGDMTLEGDDGALRKFRMLTKVYNGHMPPKQPLDDATYSAFQAEMLAEVDQPPDASPNP